MFEWDFEPKKTALADTVEAKTPMGCKGRELFGNFLDLEFKNWVE